MTELIADCSSIQLQQQRAHHSRDIINVPDTKAASAAAEVDVKWLTFAESKLLPQRHEG